jgi:glyoxylase-like metal-dependent hydrolase (beta-lactamase superfamily II)
MIFRQLFEPDTSTYTYLLGDADRGEAVLIDPVDRMVERDLALVDELGLTLTHALETHVHADHITGGGHLRKNTGCKLGVSVHGGVACADLQLAEGDVIRFGRFELSVIETPGHTDSCVSYHCQDKLFTGDALFVRGCGRTDFQQGDANRLYDSITGKLFVLPDATFVYPGHDYKGMTCSTIGEEKRFNPRLTRGRAAFVELMNNLNLAPPRYIKEAVPANLKCGLEHP